DHGIEVDESLIIRIEDTEHCDEKINELLENKSVDAILAVNELFAVTAIKLAMSKGIKIPEDLSVVAFTDGIISKYSTPTITTISQNGIKMGRKAAEILINRLELEDEDDEHYRTEIIETNLIIRESTKS
ncbi:MAG: substrate-binding domain-containing protein, partial [Flavobacterium sp.]